MSQHRIWMLQLLQDKQRGEALTNMAESRELHIFYLLVFPPVLFEPQKPLPLVLFYWAVSRHVIQRGWPFGSGIARELAKSKPKLLNGGPSRSWLQTGSFPSTLVKWVQYGAILVSNSPWSRTRMRAEPSAVLFSVGSHKCKVRVRMEWIDFRKWGRTFGWSEVCGRHVFFRATSSQQAAYMLDKFVGGIRKVRFDL